MCFRARVTGTIDELRRQLRERFPQAQVAWQEPVEEPVASASPFSGETFPPGAISEVIPSDQESGLGLLLAGLMGEPEEFSPLPSFILIDGGDGFDPSSLSETACSRLLWVRCSSAMEMLKAGDLLVRDGNVPFVLLDASGLAARDLRALPASAWWRLKQTAERTGCRIVVLSAFPLVPCANLRLSVSAGLTLEDFDLPRSELLSRLRAVPERIRRVT